MVDYLKAPFPWFGGKSRVADIVWAHFGDVDVYVEPFFGSGAVLLGRPYHQYLRNEIANDYDGYIANFWRSVKWDPEQVAEWADWPITENDLHARHRYIIANRDALQEQLEADPNYYNAQIAGYWLWGICLFIGGGRLWGKTLCRARPHLSRRTGIHQQMGQLDTQQWMEVLSERFRHVRVTCGDWTRTTGYSVITEPAGISGIFLDPPYDESRESNLYRMDSHTIGEEVRAWCLEAGENPKHRIALCGYAETSGHEELEEHGWTVVPWKAQGGYANMDEMDLENAPRERIWFSPGCLRLEELGGVPIIDAIKEKQHV